MPRKPAAERQTSQSKPVSSPPRPKPAFAVGDAVEYSCGDQGSPAKVVGYEWGPDAPTSVKESSSTWVYYLSLGQGSLVPVSENRLKAMQRESVS